jgi:hypothetical protein
LDVHCTPHWVKCESRNKDGVTPTDDEVTQERLRELKREIDKERRNSEQLVAKSLLAVFGGLILYLLHWRLAQRTSSGQNDKVAA